MVNCAKPERNSHVFTRMPQNYKAEHLQYLSFMVYEYFGKTTTSYNRSKFYYLYVVQKVWRDGLWSRAPEALLEDPGLVPSTHTEIQCPLLVIMGTA